MLSKLCYVTTFHWGFIIYVQLICYYAGYYHKLMENVAQVFSYCKYQGNSYSTGNGNNCKGEFDIVVSIFTIITS